MSLLRNKTPEPLEVIVMDHHYDCFGPATLRSQWLYKVLEMMGGINESVEDGVYHFNIVRKGLHLNASLDRIDSQ